MFEAIEGPLPDIEVTDEAMQAYRELRDQLTEALRTNGAQYFTVRENPGSTEGRQQLAGLLNQGATCYLNSLLQTFYMIPELRSQVLASNCQSPVVQELKGLFARLQLSSHAALSTKPLTTAFGWSSADVFRQHDVQELCRILFDGLEQSDSGLGESIRQLFAGELTDVLKCPDCGYTRKQTNSFLDIQLEIQGKPTLEDALRAFTAPEVLDADNKWHCEGCGTKVQATKYFVVERWPSIVTLHLKRFSFDLRLMKRVKIYDEITIPTSFDPACFSAHAASAGTIDGTEPKLKELFAILVHSGTAQGGHYYAYIKDGSGAWLEFNDACVRVLSEQELHSLLHEDLSKSAVQPEEAVATEDSVVVKASKRHVASNAYMLLYRDPCAASIEAQIDSELSDCIRTENEIHRRLVQAYTVQRMFTQLRVFSPFAPDKNSELVLDVLVSTRLAEVVVQAREHLISTASGQLPPSVTSAPSECFRLRRYNPHSGSPGETFGGREQSTLRDLGLFPAASLLLEVRAPEQKFEEFDPSDIHVTVARWDHASQQIVHSAGYNQLIKVPGKGTATVGDLLGAVRESMQITDEHICLMKLDPRDIRVLDDVSKQLRRDYHVVSGDLIVVETRPSDSSEIEALAWFRRQFTSITVQFNHPSDPQNFQHSILTSLDKTLGELLKEIAGVLNVSPESIHLRRNIMAPQLKELTKTLSSLGIVDSSTVCVCEGGTLLPTQRMLEFVASDDSDQKRSPMTTLPIDENMLVKDIKKVLGDQLQVDHACIRLKHPSTRAILRDDRRLSRVVLNVSDGMQIFVQILPSPEIIGPDDLVVEVREVSFIRKCISKGKDLVLPKSTSVSELYARVALAFPELTAQPTLPASGISAEPADMTSVPNPLVASNSEKSINLAPEPDNIPAHVENATSAHNTQPDGSAQVTETPGDNPVERNPLATTIELASKLGIAKAFTHGPPLTLKSVLKLKWNDESWLQAANIHDAPITLRDGSLLVVRSESDFARAKTLARARQEQLAKTDPSSQVRPATNARTSRVGTARKLPRPQAPQTEHSLRIDFS